MRHRQFGAPSRLIEIKTILLKSGKIDEARIRTACSELNQKFVVSKTFAELLDLKEWQQEDLGAIELKGKKDEMQLVALKI